MPPRPRAPRSRVSTIRRPRVAGLAPAAQRADGTDVAGTGRSPDAGVIDAPSGPARSAAAGTPPEAPTVESPTVEPAWSAGGAGAGSSVPWTAGLRGPVVALLATALVLLTGLAVFVGIADARLRGTPSASNAALVDVGATAEAAGQLTDALETVYSYDFTRLDENERAARDVITPEFGLDFEKLFAQVRELAPQRQAVVSATVQLSAIQNIDGDRAVLVAFMDQRASTAAEGAAAQQLAASGRLTVTGERVDGRWKIAGVESR